VPADWYRLRELFAEEQAGNPRPSLTPSGNFVPTPVTAHPDLGLRARLLLAGPPGRRSHITEQVGTAILATFNSSDDPLTGTASALVALMHAWTDGPLGLQPLAAPRALQLIHPRRSPGQASTIEVVD
jgi:hypothetical protein